jgi:hypothetical protein
MFMGEDVKVGGGNYGSISDGEFQRVIVFQTT